MADEQDKVTIILAFDTRNIASTVRDRVAVRLGVLTGTPDDGFETRCAQALENNPRLHRNTLHDYLQERGGLPADKVEIIVVSNTKDAIDALQASAALPQRRFLVTGAHLSEVDDQGQQRKADGLLAQAKQLIPPHNMFVLTMQHLAADMKLNGAAMVGDMGEAIVASEIARTLGLHVRPRTKPENLAEAAAAPA